MKYAIDYKIVAIYYGSKKNKRQHSHYLQARSVFGQELFVLEQLVKRLANELDQIRIRS
jgi:hypothetical protein